MARASAGYESQSEADMALCCLLAFLTGGDRARMDELFRRSGLIRERWDEVHYAKGPTYGQKTSERAISSTSKFYEPESGSGSEKRGLWTQTRRSHMSRSTTRIVVRLIWKRGIVC